MTTIAQGIFSSSLHWEYIYIGLALGVVLVVVDRVLRRTTRSLCLPPLAVGMGIYLPPSVQTPLVVGAVLAGVIVVSVTNGGSEAPLALVGKDFADTAEYLGLAVFAAFLVMFSKVVLSGKR